MEELKKVPQETGELDMQRNIVEGYIQILRGLISYHERMTMGNYPERDVYLDALRFALTRTEEWLQEHEAAQEIF